MLLILNDKDPGMQFLLVAKLSHISANRLRTLMCFALCSKSVFWIESILFL